MVDKDGSYGINIASARYERRGPNMPKLKPEEVVREAKKHRC